MYQISIMEIKNVNTLKHSVISIYRHRGVMITKLFSYLTSMDKRTYVIQ